MKRIIILLDGTSNSLATSDPKLLTNLYGLHRAIHYGSTLPQITFYVPGVGTRGDVTSRATGRGLDQMIKEAYVHLSGNYEEGDEIFVFGYSRGAAAARAFAGMLSKCGLLFGDALHLLSSVWQSFLDPNFKRSNAYFRDHLWPTPTISAMGLFDTVSGSSWDALRLFVKVGFASSSPDPCVANAIHILAADDRRRPWYAPLVWTRASTNVSQSCEQIWMPGVHADIGGSSSGEFVSLVALLTMIDKVKVCSPSLEWEPTVVAGFEADLQRCEQVHITQEFCWYTSFMRPGVVRNAIGYNATRHVTLERINGRKLLVAGRIRVYKPRALGWDTLPLCSTSYDNFFERECDRASQ